ncbi:hypothetical protein EC968_004400, partial [Mortierella alpina]
GLEPGDSNYGGSICFRDSHESSSFNFNCDYGRADDDSGDMSLVSGCGQFHDRLQTDGSHYSSDNLDFGARSTFRTSRGDQKSVYSNQIASQSVSHVNRMEFEKHLHFRTTESEGSVADDFSYDSDSATDTSSGKWASLSDTNTKTIDPVKSFRRLSNRLTRCSTSPGVRSTAVLMPAWSKALFTPRVKQHANERRSSAPSEFFSEQASSTLPVWSSVSRDRTDGESSLSSSTLQSSNDASGPAAHPGVFSPSEAPQSTPTTMLRTAAPITRTPFTKSSCSCYNRNVRGPCNYHRNLKDAQRLSKRRSRDTPNRQSGKERSTDKSKAGKRILHRLSMLSTAFATAAKRMSLDAEPKTTYVPAAPTATSAVEVAATETKSRHQQKQVYQPSSGSTFQAQEVTDCHPRSRPMNSCSLVPGRSECSSSPNLLDGPSMCKSDGEQQFLPQDHQLGLHPWRASSVCEKTYPLSQTAKPSHAVHGKITRPASELPSESSILDSQAYAGVSTINVCAEIISPKLQIRARSATVDGVNEQEFKSNTHSPKEGFPIAKTTVTTTTATALATLIATAGVREPLEASTNRNPPYEKEKLAFFKPFKSQTQSSTYVSFHHDLSHIESSPLLESKEDSSVSKEVSSAEFKPEEPLKTAPGSPIVPCQCSKPTRFKRTPASLPSMSLPNLASSAVNVMITSPQSHKRNPPPPPPPRPRPQPREEDEGPFLTLQEYLWQKERTPVAAPTKAAARNSHPSDDIQGGLNGMATVVSLPTVSNSSVASSLASGSPRSTSTSTTSSAATSIAGLSKVIKESSSQKRRTWLSWMGP